VLDTQEGPVTVVTGQGDLFLGLYAPKFPADARTAVAVVPQADLTLLHAIPPIGNKFHKASDTGPMGQKNLAAGVYRGTVYLYFGEFPQAGGAASQ
jgi:hypothetical protein